MRPRPADGGCMRFPRHSRREWMSLCGRGALGACLAGRSGGFGAARGFRIGACDWTLGRRSSPDALAVAKRIGLDGVQVDLGHPKDGMPLLKPEVRAAYLEAASRQGIEIASLAIGVLNEFPLKSDPRAEEWVAGSIEASKALGTRVVLLAFFGNGDLRGDTAGVETVVRKLRQLAPLAEKAGVTLGFESWLSAPQHIDILDRVGSPGLGVYYDVANSHKEGHDIYKEIRQLGARICEFHAKDYDALYGRGSIRFPEVRGAMDAIGYRGWIHMEGTQLPFGIEQSLKQNLEYLRGVFPREA